MSPNLNKNPIQECADCGSSNTKWASINHGVLICDDCCLVHRGLGRCISIIKSITKSYWPQSLIDTIYELVRSNSNQIWESNLNSPEMQQHKQIPRKKPTHKDQINPTKTNFIKAKYENLYYIARGKYSSIEDLNQQLYNAVKTNNYELCLRILSQGADANYKNIDDSFTCLHNAVLHSQLGQIELLCIYGADLTAVDRNGNTPYDLAKINNLNNIADRLIELQFELTDDLTYFICNKRPDHKSGQHFLIPDLSENGENNDFLKITKNRLQELPDHLFEELCKDIFDEADRRQLETIWKCSVGQNLINEPIPFLVIKSCFSQTRNQLRQKLARFNNNEFSNLIIEILIEAKQRYESYSNSQKSQKNIQPRKLKQLHNESIEDDPLYDKVPSDEDYASVASEPTTTSSSLHQNIPSFKNSIPIKNLNINTLNSTSNNNNNSVNINVSLSNPVSTLNSPNTRNELLTINRNSNSSKSQLNAKIISKEHKIVELKTNFEKINSLNTTPISTISNSKLNSNSKEELSFKSKLNELHNENELMKSMINSLMEENAQLRAEKMFSTMNNGNKTMNSNNNNNELYIDDSFGIYSTVNKKSSSLKTIRTTNNSPLKSFNLNFTKPSNDDSEILKIEIEKKNRRDSDYENQNNNQVPLIPLFNREISNDEKRLSTFNKQYSNENINGNNLFNRLMKKDSPISSLPNSPLSFSPNPLTNNKNKLNTFNANDSNYLMPSKETVIRKMKKITKIIQELYKTIKESRVDLYKNFCDKVNQSVTEMIQLFPPNLNSEELQEYLTILNETCRKLTDLIYKNNNQLLLNNETQQNTNNNKSGQLSNSSSTSSAISTISNGGAVASNNDHFSNNQIASFIITYCYDIAFTVKKIVCVFGADN